MYVYIFTCIYNPYKVFNNNMVFKINNTGFDIAYDSFYSVIKGASSLGVWPLSLF